MFYISEVSRRLHVHNQTLRNWEKQGLIIPNRIGKVRIYSDQDIKQCEEIKKYSGRGVKLRGISELFQAREHQTSGNGGEE